jgi:3-hydroxyisobutyrate dehydrogenase-like beta-hydroxyacid dehydrogenase
VESVGFVGFGEAARCFAAAFSGELSGGTRVFCDGPRHSPPYDEAFLGEIAGVGATAVGSLGELVRSCDVVFSAVTVDQAESVGTAIIEEADSQQLVVDLNAATPSVKQRLAARSNNAGVRYVDASIMGAVSIYGHGVQLICSGEGASDLDGALRPFGFDVQVLEGPAGAAAGVKMLRSVVTKGMEALLVEALTAARAFGIVESAFAGICGPMDATTYSEFAVMCIKTDVLHAGRRALEMQEITTELEQLGIDPIMTSATTKRLRASARLGLRDQFAARPSYAYQDVLDAYHEVSGTAVATADGSVSGSLEIVEER